MRTGIKEGLVQNATKTPISRQRYVHLAKGWNSKRGYVSFMYYKIHRTHRMRGMHSRCRLAVFRFFAVDPWARVEYTPSLHLLLTIMRRSKETTARVCAYGCSPICRDRYLGFFSFGNGDCGHTAYQHACRRVSGLREDAPWFVCRWLLASAVSWPSSQQFRSTAPRFLRFRFNCPRNELSMALDSTQLSLFINPLLLTR